MKIFYFFLGFIVISILSELFESYLRKNNFEDKYPIFGNFVFLLKIVGIFIITCFLVYDSYDNLLKTGTIDNFAHLFMLFIPIVIILYMYTTIREKLKK